MATDLVWACPHCGTGMSPGDSTMLRHWHCARCNFDWISGEALAAFLPTVRAFVKLRNAAAAAEPSPRPLECPTCRARSLHVVKAGAGVRVDVCPKCVGVALDPGELRMFKIIGRGPTKLALDVFDVATGIEALLQMLMM